MATLDTPPRIAGWIPASMLDWPGRVVTTVFLSGCNARCAYCHNPELTVANSISIESGALLRHLRDRQDWIDGVVVTGGEPTTDPGLLRLLEAVHELGLPAKLDTNGTRPETLAGLIEAGLVTAVALDVKTVPERYDEVTGIIGAWPLVQRSINAIIDSGIDHEFRTTVHPGSIEPHDIPRIARALEGGQRYVLQQFRTDRLLDSESAGSDVLHPDVLHGAATRCCEWIPTTTRGA